MPNLPMNGARYPAAMRDVDSAGVPVYMSGGARNNAIRMATPVAVSTGLQNASPLPATSSSGCSPLLPGLVGSAPQDPPTGGNWRQAGDEMRRLRSRHVVLIERMLRNHQPHDVLTQVPENFDWHSKTFTLAIKIERLMFTTATSRENYLNENTLRSRVQLLSRHLVRLRKRKNAAAAYETRV